MIALKARLPLPLVLRNALDAVGDAEAKARVVEKRALKLVATATPNAPRHPPMHAQRIHRQYRAGASTTIGAKRHPVEGRLATALQIGLAANVHRAIAVQILNLAMIDVVEVLEVVVEIIANRAMATRLRHKQRQAIVKTGTARISLVSLRDAQHANPALNASLANLARLVSRAPNGRRAPAITRQCQRTAPTKMLTH